MIRDGFKEIEMLGRHLDDIISELLEARLREQNVYCIFNGYILYSDTISEDDAYLAIYDCTKEEKEEQDRIKADLRKKYIAKNKRENKAHEAKIPQLTKEYIEKAKEILDPQYMASWIECVPIRLKDLYKGMELQATLDLVKLLNNDRPFDEVKEALRNQSHSGMSEYLVKLMLIEFCNRGNQFRDYLEGE